MKIKKDKNKYNYQNIKNDVENKMLRIYLKSYFKLNTPRGVCFIFNFIDI